MRLLKRLQPAAGTIDMTEGNPVRLILRFSTPFVIGNLFQHLYSFVDATVVGNFVGVKGFAAISCASWITWLVNAVLRDCSNAASITASIRVGNRNEEGYRKVAANAAMFAAFLCVLTVTILLTTMQPILSGMGVAEEIRSLAQSYLTIIVLAMPFGISFHTIAALLRAADNSDATLYGMTTSTIVNIVLDLLFVAVLKWSVAGAAAATLIAQASALCVVLWQAKKCDLLRLSRRHWQIDWKLIRELVRLWLPMMANSVVISLGGIYVQRTINTLGTHYIAGIESSVTIFGLLEAIIMAIQTGACVFVGQNLGAERPERIRTGMHRILLTAQALTVVMIIGVWLFADPIVSMFLSKENEALYLLTHEVGVKSAKTFMSGLIIMTPMYPYRASLQTLGHPNYAVIAAGLQVIARILTVELLPQLIGEYAYYIPTVTAWIVTLPVVVIPYYIYLGRMCRQGVCTPVQAS